MDWSTSHIGCIQFIFVRIARLTMDVVTAALQKSGYEKRSIELKMPSVSRICSRSTAYLT